MREHINTFVATDLVGNVYEVHEVTEGGIRELRTSTGLAVDRSAKGKYSIAQAGGAIELTSDDPNLA
ncbi:MAG: hypothetical protein ACREJC_16080 [Tepidisphaeraceae bacterium]